AYSRVEQDAIWAELLPILECGRFGDAYLDGLSEAALVVLPQGWYLVADNRAGIVAGVAADAWVTSMVELYFALHPGPVAAITGTNGKSTTVGLTEHLLAAGGVAFRTAGNERSNRQFLPEVDSVPRGTWALLETSNRQLLQLDRSPQVAAITALTPDHLDEHGGYEGYRDTKARLFAQQGVGDVAIANADDREALAVAERSPAANAGRLVRCGIGPHAAPSVTWVDGLLIATDVPDARDATAPRTQSYVVATADDLRMPGAHNQRNAAVAVAVALACGADVATLAEGLRTFEGKALRLQRLDIVGGVEVWSDLKATTPEATVAALDALAPAEAAKGTGSARRRVWLIVGGDDKGLDYGPLAESIASRGVQAFAVPGTATDALQHALEATGHGALLECVPDLHVALDRGFESAVSGDIVIVSPAAAGFWTRELQGNASLRSLVRRRAQVPEEAHDR
ncbi:MAG: UDP-N-acetylmuramoyl-L-alanyl-D-glutamate synthetase, partial [Thermoleophilia bacterium]|nr:UDP-N-acetylmuramoyl-L-alanyl-D-glutamate synthetase [Thermoleophilia bacterium]